MIAPKGHWYTHAPQEMHLLLSMVAAFSSDLYRVPFVIGPSVYATASLVVCAAALLSAVAVRQRINHLDMVEVLKTRE